VFRAQNWAMLVIVGDTVCDLTRAVANVIAAHRPKPARRTPKAQILKLGFMNGMLFATLK
jgi:hypothetical protein